MKEKLLLKFPFSRSSFKVCRIIERLEFKEWFCLIALHAGSAHFTELYGVQGTREAFSKLQYRAITEHVKRMMNSLEEKKKAQRASEGLHKTIASHSLSAAEEQWTHRFAQNYILHMCNRIAYKWAYTFQWRMYKNVFWWHKFKILPDFVQLNLNVMFNIISQPYFNLKW